MPQCQPGETQFLVWQAGKSDRPSIACSQFDSDRPRPESWLLIVASRSPPRPRAHDVCQSAHHSLLAHRKYTCGWAAVLSSRISPTLGERQGDDAVIVGSFQAASNVAFLPNATHHVATSKLPGQALRRPFL